jgi:hypothetical protein
MYIPNQTREISPKTFLKTISIIHLALMMGQVLFGIVVFTQVHTITFNLKDTHDPFLLVVPIMAIGSFTASVIVFKQLLNAATAKEPLSAKITAYQSALIVRFALLEGASLFGIVTFLLTGNLLFIGISGLLVLYFLIIRPTKDKVQTDLNLSYEETSELG